MASSSAGSRTGGHRLPDAGSSPVAKAELRKRRLAAARAEARRDEAPPRGQRRQSAREAWAERKQREILYLGDDVSTSLGQREGQVRTGLPALTRRRDPSRGRWASPSGSSGSSRSTAGSAPPPTGVGSWSPRRPAASAGSAPRCPASSGPSSWVLTDILEKVPVHDAAHGFVARSLDRDQRPRPRRPAGRGQPRSQGLLPDADLDPGPRAVRVASATRRGGRTVLALLCTEPEVDEVEIDGRRWFVHRQSADAKPGAVERFLPQGSPCSAM